MNSKFTIIVIILADGSKFDQDKEMLYHFQLGLWR